MVGIVAEYNPFHNGHIRQINWIKQNFPNEKIVVVMSDKFSQRGEYTITSFFKRKQIAKKYGVSKVIKLSFEQSVQAAHIFAYNAIMRLNQVGVDKIVFGSESNDVQQMIDLATYLNNHLDLFNQHIRYFLKKEKLAYPKAFALALKQISGKNYTLPNDILGFEYVKTIINNNLNIKIFSIKRNIDFHSQLTLNQYASASLLRQKIKKNEDISHYSPMKIKKGRFIENDYLKFKKILLSTPLTKLKKIQLISEGIENLFLKNIYHSNYDDFIQACVSKRYTASRIKRIYAWILNKKWK
ncbi:nucleotidyltransferase [Mycoplasmopsis phocirhinis]|uniref:Nucleotidyltransferase n=1 Tax=Mycoplasmopsis phocirhinis TaxID=142650 RepID=A0A4P6MTW6_9BACT|nr:nucleotidyltransferase [Mycoplasmopsis phocirhinis]QBF34837.1 nucleotidyltransferase [Mycoplasmopsis phocirhinis]